MISCPIPRSTHEVESGRSASKSGRDHCAHAARCPPQPSVLPSPDGRRPPRGFVAEPWSDALDFSTLENRSAAFVSDGLRQRCGDSLWRLRCGETWLYVPLEFQSTVDRSMAVRLLTYTGLLYQDLFRRGEVDPDGKLPPVLPVVFCNGRRSRWMAPLDVTDTVSSVLEALTRYQPSLRYFLLRNSGWPSSGIRYTMSSRVCEYLPRLGGSLVPIGW